MGGLAANFSGKFLQSTRGPVERLGSNFFGENFAKCHGATGGGNLLGTLGIPGARWRARQQTFQENFAKCPRVSGESWQCLAAIFSVEISLTTLVPVERLGSRLFSENSAKYPGPGEARQQTFRGNIC